MKRSRWLVFGILGLVLAVGLTGCKITGATPDPGTIIEMKPGDKVIFKVVGPVNTPTTKCVWTINNSATNEVVSEGKNEFELDFNADSKLSNKKNIITCALLSYKYNCVCGPICLCSWQWVTPDYRKWEIRTNSNSATVITGDYILENDSDLQLLKGYTTVTGSLIIGPNINSLEGLESLSTIGGGLSIKDNNALSSLSGLDNVTSVDGDLLIDDIAITSLSGLGKLTSVGGDLKIGDSYYESNDSLTSLSGLGNLVSVGGDLEIRYNKALTSLNGLDNLTSVGGNLNIESNKVLTNLSGLQNVTSVVGSLDIVWNSALTTLSGLQNITSVGGTLHIYGNAVLTSLSGLENLTSVGEGLNILDNATLSSLGLGSLRFVGSSLFNGGFHIEDNPALCKSMAEELRNQCILVIGSTTISGNKECTTP